MFPSSINIAEICITLYDMSGLCIVFVVINACI